MRYVYKVFGEQDGIIYVSDIGRIERTSCNLTHLQGLMFDQLDDKIRLKLVKRGRQWHL